MSAFTDFEAFSRLPGTRTLYSLDGPLTWEVGKRGSGWTLNIPAGTTFDISVPRFLEWAQSPHDRRVLLAAAVHDELMRQGCDRPFASGEFRRACMARGVPCAFAWALYFATLLATGFARDARLIDRQTTI
jgi:hypothetical protein